MLTLKIVFGALCIAIAAAAGIALATRVRQFVTAIRAERWLSTRGRIVESSLARLAGGWLWRPEVSYEYYVGSRRHLGHRISAASELPVIINAEQRVQRYRPGRDVTVYYDPADEDRAVLERTGALILDVYMIGLIAVIAAAVYVLWMLADGM
jgi:hypothetical protein